ncbi:outer membrane beta-barrel domain protein [Vibrio galatheae]|uniref:Outer membrane beta-barrel domain protein n=1 Tax=Vibrio galatheae TaxID=579748 RepID=A0A0F4NKV6_9VIBR|nr:outer membrane beta-barrel protein [Vibrio galatheae]KJY83469.1 outer membrane beta-barrel domain protein [Vibrio galatheae]
MKTLTLLFLSIALSMTSAAARTEILFSPWVGYTFGGSVEDQDSNELSVNGAESFALSIEANIDNGRLGLFYATQTTEVERVNSNVSIHYLHFQSSVYYPVTKQLTSYLGLGVGGSYIDADWVGQASGFSASIFSGFEYPLSDTIAFNSQLRWLGTVVDNETSGACSLPAQQNNSCVIRFKTDWMNQFSLNLGLTFRF